MPMHKNMPDFVDKNHRNSTFVKERSPTSKKGVLAEGRSFMDKAQPSLIKAVPDAKQLVNRMINLEKDA